ncbi:MAG: bifunctional phosphopantothenoylcysteine decarboxylase/phosphopantothenate--cysteine ligase CoaBC, partial [Candidatus Micrarchaeia archaeon]
MRSLKGKTIILGVTGSVAAIKSAQLARLLKKEGATVRAVLTESGRQMLSKQQRSKLEKETGKPLQSQLFTNNVKKHVEREAQRKARGLHVDLAEKADLLLIAPATANTIANLSHGKTQDEHGNADLLHTIHLGMEPYKLAIAPAMHQQMWKHPATRKNLKILEKRGAKIIRPVSGKLASGDIGEGRMQEPKEIVRAVKKQLTIQESLKGKKILVNAGPTRVFIDEVRFISNPFSGALGHEIAKEAAKRGAEVVLLQGKSGKHVPPELEDLNVKCEYFDEPLETRRGVPSLMELMKKHVG